MVLLILISFLSYKFVERPFRDKNKINNKNFLKTFAIYITFILSISYLTIVKQGNFFGLPQILAESHSTTFNKVFQNGKALS